MKFDRHHFISESVSRGRGPAWDVRPHSHAMKYSRAVINCFILATVNLLLCGCECLVDSIVDSHDLDRRVKYYKGRGESPDMARKKAFEDQFIFDRDRN